MPDGSLSPFLDPPLAAIPPAAPRRSLLLAALDFLAQLCALLAALCCAAGWGFVLWALLS